MATKQLRNLAIFFPRNAMNHYLDTLIIVSIMKEYILEKPSNEEVAKDLITFLTHHLKFMLGEKIMMGTIAKYS
jgi:hypothetical protein